jgi:hypothetical protein
MFKNICDFNFKYTSLILKYIILMQHTSISPDRKLMTVVGDNLDGLLVDPLNGKVHGSSLIHLLVSVFRRECEIRKGFIELN